MEYFNEKPDNKTKYFELTKLSRSGESSGNRKLADDMVLDLGVEQEQGQAVDLTPDGPEEET